MPTRAEIAQKLSASFKFYPKTLSALRSFIGSGQRLTIVLGNHDLELHLDSSRFMLRKLLGSASEDSLRFVADGQAYAVGDVIVEHGNQYDLVNAIDYDSLRRLRSALSRRSSKKADLKFSYPTGSHIVADIANPLSRQYPFLPFLKPETAAAVPLLLALDPRTRWKLLHLARLFFATHYRKLPTAVRTYRIGRLSRSSGPSSTSGHAASPRTVQPHRDALLQLLKLTGPPAAACFLQRRDLRAIYSTGLSVHSLARSLGPREAGLRLLFSRHNASTEHRLKLLTAALQALRHSDDFKVGSHESSNYLRAARRMIQDGASIVVFGHTHLAKQLAVGSHGRYFNTGTWAPLMRVPQECLAEDPQTALVATEEFCSNLQGDTWARYLFMRPTYLDLQMRRVGTKRECTTAKLFEWRSVGHRAAT